VLGFTRITQEAGVAARIPEALAADEEQQRLRAR
jgi:hypothetical protein